mgnify:FL=1
MIFLIRTEKNLLQLFNETNFDVKLTHHQKGFPDDFIDVKIYALQNSE